MKKRTFRENLKTPAFRELLIIGSVTVILVLLATTMHWTEAVVHLLYRLKSTGLDDILVSFSIIGFLLTIYTIRRYNEKIELIRSIKRTEAKLHKTHEQLEVLIKSSSAILFRTKIDDGFTLIDATENVKQVLGYSKDELFEKGFWVNHLHPEDAPKVLSKIPQLLESGVFGIEYRFKHKDGSWRWMRTEMKCLFDKNRKPYEMVGNWWDITEQKQIAEDVKAANERFELSFKATKNVMYDWDLVTNHLWLSDEIYRSYGYDKETFKPDIHWWEDKIHSDDREVIESSVMNAIAKKEDSWSGEYCFKLANGTYADIFDRGHISYSADGKPLRWIGSMNDITVLKKTESKLKEALIKSEELAKAKSEFLANMSHEIRTPLNGIVGMTDLALDTELTAEQKRYLETVKLSCDSLLALINDILDFSKIEAGKLDLSPVNFSLRDELPAFLSPLALKASHKKLEFVFSIQNDVPDSLFGDIYRLHQITTNLVGNAIKFTERGEIVLNVELQSATDDEAMLLFSVTDTGIGIPAHKLDAVFEDFTQADGTTTRKYGGTGLGLSITKRLVEMMGGKIWVESIENKGSAFYFTVMMKSQNKIQKPRFIPLPVLDNTPVLVIEDNDLSRKCTVRILENFNMKPIAVDSGEKAIDELKKAAQSGHPFPIVITDISLSGKMDGFDVVERIKEDKDLANPEIIVISMSQQVSDNERFAQLGVKQCFSKPFSQSDLLDSIQNTLSARNNITSQLIENYTPQIMPVISSTGDPMRILLAEDNLVNQEVAAMILNKKGHTVIIANNGAEAAAVYLNEAFDLILMDVQMPLLNGYEATERIRDIENITGKHTPIIGLTANAMKGDREKCLEAGMDDYVSKPVRINELMAAIDRIKQKTAAPENHEASVEKNAKVCLDTLLENLDGDHEVLDSILGNFDSTVMVHMNAIEANAKKGKASDIIFLSHTLKGQCMLVEMERVVKLAGQMETLASQNALTEVNQLVPVLKSELQKGLKALKEARVNLFEGEAA